MTIEEAKQTLKNAGYQVENLWHVNDVEADLTDEEKLKLLTKALTNEATMEQIQYTINELITEKL